MTMKIPTDPKEEKEKKEEDPDNVTTTASGWTQVMALMEKNALTKIRTPGATLAELFCPVLLCLVLYISFNLSDVVYYPAKYYHAINVDFPLFWDSGAYADDEAEDFDLADTHRRHLKLMDKDHDDGDDKTSWSWAELLDEWSGSARDDPEDAELEEHFGLINDVLMMRHLKTFTIIDEVDDEANDEEAEEEDDSDDVVTKHREHLHDDQVALFPTSEDAGDSGDWYHEILADVKKDTVDKIDWAQVEEEIKDNFGDLWDAAKDYILTSNTRSAKSRLNQMRLRVRTKSHTHTHDVVVVVPTSTLLTPFFTCFPVVDLPRSSFVCVLVCLCL